MIQIDIWNDSDGPSQGRKTVYIYIYLYIIIWYDKYDPYSEPIFMRDQYNCYNNVVS